MRIRWLGHACFRLETGTGLVVVTDPYDETVGYTFPETAADVVTVSHDHFDHNHVQAVAGHPLILRGAGEHSLDGLDPRKTEGVQIRGVASFHDAVGGRQRGGNTIFCFTLEGMRVVHLGDLGHQLTPAQQAEIGPVDVLLVPVGGTYTLDAAGAAQVVEQLRPRVVIPMHYRTKALSFPLAPVDDFLRGKAGVERLHQTTLEITADGLSSFHSPRTVVLEYC